MPRRDNSGRRRLPTQSRRTILVYCGAVRTEPDYLDGLRRKFRTSGVTVKVRQDGTAPGGVLDRHRRHRTDRTDATVGGSAG